MANKEARPSYITGVFSADDHTAKRTGNDEVATGGSGPHDPGMEARVAVLEQIAKQTSETLAEIRTEVRIGFASTRDRFDTARDRHDRDFRITFGAIIAVALGLAGLVAKGFKWF